MSDVRFRHPDRRDGGAIWELVRSVGTLEPNTCYAYLLLADHFAETCLIAERGGEPVGVVVGYQPPGREDVLFVWQIGVAESARGEGLGRRLLLELLRRRPQVRHLETTVAPSNQASRRLFTSTAEALSVPIRSEEGYPRELFPGGEHEDETLFRIGPLEVRP